MVKDTFTHTIKLIRDRFDVQHVMSTTNIAIATNVHMQIFYAWCRCKTCSNLDIVIEMNRNEREGNSSRDLRDNYAEISTN